MSSVTENMSTSTGCVPFCIGCATVLCSALPCNQLQQHDPCSEVVHDMCVAMIIKSGQAGPVRTHRKGLRPAIAKSSHFAARLAVVSQGRQWVIGMR